MKNRMSRPTYLNILIISLSLILIPKINDLSFAVSKPSLKELKKEALNIVEAKSQLLIDISNSIWEFAEIALLEHKSADLLGETLEKEGFQVKRSVAGMPTALVASFGSGNPIIGILAEYDALPGLSQENLPYKKALIEGEAGHGCGHNLFAGGSLGAALAVKEVIEKNNLKGTIRLYGCPAEEDVAGSEIQTGRESRRWLKESKTSLKGRR